jgi:hypothetical protein
VVSEPVSIAGLFDPCPAAMWALAPSGVVTATSTVVPGVPAGPVAVIWLSLSTTKPVAGGAPKSTADAPVNPEPEISTDVPPVFAPLDGAKPPTTGGAQVPVEADTSLLLALSQFR